MSPLEIILISVVTSMAVTFVFSATALWLIWHRVPRLRLKVQKFLFSAPGEGAGVFDPKILELEQRLGKVDKALTRLVHEFDREVAAGKRAEVAMVDVMKGLTRSAMRTDERLKSIEKENS